MGIYIYIWTDVWTDEWMDVKIEYGRMYRLNMDGCMD